MSWAKDEWKQGLSVHVLEKITELERQTERFVKDNKQKQFQIETQTAALAKQKRLTDEEKDKAATLKRENQILSESCAEFERTKQKLQHEIQSKEGRLSCFEGQVSRLKQSLDNEICKHSQTKADLERAHSSHEQCSRNLEKKTAEFDKLKELSSFQKRQIEGQKEKIKSFESQKSFSKSSQSSCDSYDDFDNKDPQTKMDAEVFQRQKLEKQVKDLQDMSSVMPKDGVVPFTSLCLDNNQELHLNSNEFKEAADSNQKLAELRNTLYKVELQLQDAKNELMNKFEDLKEKDLQISNLKQNLDETYKQNDRTYEDLVKSKTELDQAKLQIESFERKCKQLNQELQCQRHNTEAIIKGHEDRSKEKEKQHREEMSSQMQALAALEKQHQDVLNKMKQQEQASQTAQRELESNTDQKLREVEKLKRQLDDAKHDGSNKESAIKAKETTINELAQEIKSLKQEKNVLLTQIEEESASKKKLETQLQVCKSEIELKNAIVNTTESEAIEKVKEVETVKQKLLCDLENAKIVQSRMELDIDKLQKKINFADRCIEEKENDLKEVNSMLQHSQTKCEKLGKEAHELKLNVTEEKEKASRLEATLRELKQVSICKDVDTTQMGDKLKDLETKYNALTRELASTKQELEESSKTMSKLQTDKQNLQQSLNNKEIEVKALQEKSCEMDLQQTSVNQSQISELERQLILQKESCKIASEECNKLTTELKNRKQAENELYDQIHTSSTALKEMQLIAENARIEHEQEKINSKNRILKLEEKITLLQNEKEQEKQEMSKLVQQKCEEIDDLNDKLTKKVKEVEKLREAEINLQNVLTTRDHDKAKLEVSYKEICEKSQKIEQDLLAEIDNLKREREVFEGKEKNLVISNDSLKRDILAMQNDYRKACQLSDSKSAELKELIEKFEVSQKEAEQFRQRMSRAEKTLTEREEQIKDVLKEKDCILKEHATKEEDVADLRKQLLQKSAEEQSKREVLQEKCSLLSEKLNLALAQNENEKQNNQRLAESLEGKIQEVSELTSLKSSLESKLDNTIRIVHDKESLIAQQKKQLNDMEVRFQSTIACLETDLQTKKDGERIIQNKLQKQEQAIKMLENHLKEAQDGIQNKDAELAVEHTEYEKLKTSYQEAKKSESELSEQIQNIKSAANAKTKELESVKEELHKQQMAYKVDFDGNLAKESELNDKIYKLNVELEKTESCLNAKAEELHNVKESNATLENECRELRSMMDESAELAMNLQDEMAKMKEENQRLASNIEGKHHEITKLKETLATTEMEQINILQQKEDLLKSTTNSLNTAMSDKEKLLHLLETRKQESIKVNQMYEQDVKEKECLMQQLNVLQKSLNDKSKDIECLSEQKVHLESMISKLNSQNESCLKDEIGLQDKLDIQTTLSNEKLQLLEDKLKTLSSVNEKLEDKLRHTEEQLRNTKEINVQLEQDINSSNAKIDVFQREFEKKDGDISSLRQQICNFKLVVSELNTHLQEKNNSIQSANQDLDALRSQFEVTQMDIEDKEDVIKELKNTIEALESQIKDLKVARCGLDENLKQAKSALEIKTNSLLEKRKVHEVMAAEMNLKHLKSDELIQNLQRTVKDLKDEKCEIVSKLKESEAICVTLQYKISNLEKHVEEQSQDKVSMQTGFDISVGKLKESIETLEKQVENLKKELLVSEEVINSKNDELNAIKIVIGTERRNLLSSKHVFIVENQSLKEESEAVKKRLEVSEQSLADVKSELASTLESKSLAESMLVAVDGNLQDHKQRLIDRENQIKVLDHALAEKEDQLAKMRSVSSAQSERLEQLQKCLHELNVKKKNQSQEMSQKIEDIENSRNEEVKALHCEYKVQIEELQDQYKLSLEHAQQSNIKIKELRDAFDTSRQEIVELNQRLVSDEAELKAKAQEIDAFRNKHSNLISAQENVQNDLNVTIERLKNNLSIKEDDCARLQEKMHELEEVNDSKIREYLSQLSSAKNENISLQSKLDSMSSKFEILEDDLQRSKHDIIRLNNNIEESEERFRTEALTLKENIKEIESSKNELKQKSREELIELQSSFKSTKEDLTGNIRMLEEQNKSLNEERDGLKDQVIQLQHSKEKSAKRDNEKIIELKSQLDETNHKLKTSYHRIDELVEEKRISYDAMQVAERETFQARSELEHELTTFKAKLTSITSEAENYRQQLKDAQEKNSTLEKNLSELKSKTLMLERSFKDSAIKYEDEINELRNSLESTTAELTKVTLEKEGVSNSLQHTKCDLEQALESLARFECERNNDTARECQNKDLSSAVETLQEELNLAKLAKAELNHELINEKDTICTLQRKIEMLECDIGTMKSKHATESSELEMCLENLKKRNSELSEKLAEVSEKHLLECESSIQSIREASIEKSSLSKQLEEKALRCKHLEDSNDELLEVNEKLCGKIEKLESVIEQKKNDLTSLRDASNSINRDYEDAVQELQNVRQESAEIIEIKKNKISELMDRLSKVQKVQDKNDAERKVIVQEKEDLLERISSLEKMKERFSNEVDLHHAECQELKAGLAEKTSKIKELIKSSGILQQTLDSKMQEIDEMKEFFDATNEDLDTLCEQRAQQIRELKAELTTNCDTVTKQENALKEKDEEIENITKCLHDVTKQLDQLSIKHKQCVERELKFEAMKQNILHLESGLQQEKSKSEFLQKTLEERETQWENEKEKLLSSTKTDEALKEKSDLEAALSSAEHENKQLQSTLEIKAKELSEQQLLCERRNSDFRDLEMKFKTKVDSMEQQYEDIKYTLKQKEDEVFVLKEKIQEIENLEKKVACSEEIELELRHHLGEVTQELQTLKESALNSNEESLLLQISSLKDEIEIKVTQFEEEKESIVSAAKEFAMKQEDNFGQELCAKDEKILVLESEIQQLKHDLTSAQNSRKALLEAADEREKELENTKVQLQDDGVVQGKLVELSLKLKLEKQKNSEFEDSYKKLHEQIDKSESARKVLQKQVDKLEKDHKSEEEKLVSEISSLALKIQRLQKEIKQVQSYLDDEKAKTLSLTKENYDLSEELNVLQQEAQRERIHSTETEEECRLLKQQVDGLMSAQTEAEVEKEILIVNESIEKVKLRENERHVQQMKNELEHGKKMNAELEIDKKRYQEEFESTKEKLAAIQKERDTLQQQLVKRETECADLKQDYQAQTTSLREENEKFLRKLKTAENQISSLKDHQLEELEFTKSQLTLVENKCSGLLQQLTEVKKSESKKLSTMQESMTKKSAELQAKVDELEAESRETRAGLQAKISELHLENESLKSKLERNVEQKEYHAPKNDISGVPGPNTVPSPLVRSMSSLVITSASGAKKGAKEKKSPDASNVEIGIQPHRLTAFESRLAKREETRSSKLNKRSLDHESQSKPKRSRLTSQGDSAPGPYCESPELPEGLPEVVQKGFNDIPDVPIKSPFILRRTTAQVNRKSLVNPKQSVKPKGSHIPKFSRNTAKENPAPSGSPPKRFLKPPSAVLSPRKTNVPASKSSDCKSPKKSKIPSMPTRREHARAGKTRQGPTTRSSVQLQMRLNQIEDTANADKEDFETCNMQ